jgi:hypothetical protein
MRFLGVLVLSLLCGCVGSGSSHDVVARSTSPDGTIDAITIESNGGATTSFWYDVCLAPRGLTCKVSESLVRLYGATRNGQAYGINVRWVSKSLLQVEYLQAKRVKAIQSVATVGGRNIDVALRSGVSDPSAPAGGMLYNVQDRPQDTP